MDKAIILMRGDKITINRAIPEAVEYIKQVMEDVRGEGVDVDRIMQIRDWKEVDAFLKGAAAPAPVKKKKIEFADKQTGKNQGKTAVVRKAIDGVSKQGALTSKQIAAAAGLTTSEVSEPLIRLFKTGKIGRIQGRPHRYYDIKYAKIKKRQATGTCEDLLACGMRNGRKITKDECKPNPASTVCEVCAWGQAEDAA